MNMPKMKNKNSQMYGNMGMGAASSVLVILILNGFGAETSPEAAAPLGVVLGGLFQRFNFFG